MTDSFASSKPVSPVSDTAGERLKELLRLPDGWDGYGAPPIRPEIAALATVLLTPPSIVPMSDGGIQLEWHIYSIDFEMSIYADGTVETSWGVSPAVKPEPEGSPERRG